MLDSQGDHYLFSPYFLNGSRKVYVGLKFVEVFSVMHLHVFMSTLKSKPTEGLGAPSSPYKARCLGSSVIKNGGNFDLVE